ncbi:hypothetical protein AG1IA_07862 [Rhizoctonia solani AG-1 IA]|uniref:Uncharacterized protein n=1 Tax=Thanatephorus cucumeris (strain AG1-IA) TaxID=983506 RepID=L8WMU4_THACA|nr:hypothetical protein AG1IA_07862 [Rhizoctonia solani AG-1 IA]
MYSNRIVLHTAVYHRFLVRKLRGPHEARLSFHEYISKESMPSGAPRMWDCGRNHHNLRIPGSICETVGPEG